MAKDNRFTMEDEQPMPVTNKISRVAKTYTSADMRGAFARGAAFARSHVFNPQEMNAVKAAEEALASWPD